MSARILYGKSPIFVAVAGSLMLGACTPGMVKNPGAEAARAELTALQADPNLAEQAPAAMQNADRAVSLAQRPECDKELLQHRIYLADHKVRTARSLSQAQYAVTQRAALKEEGNAVRLAARTREVDLARDQARRSEAVASDAIRAADAARSDTASAESEAYMARVDADISRSQVDTARGDTELAQRDAENSRYAAEVAREDADTAFAEKVAAKRETSAALEAADAARRSANTANQSLLILLADLDAKATERGVQLTLGDVLFSTGRADLMAGTAAKLDKLVNALNNEQDRRITIEGFTDSVGSDGMNQTLSQNRADAVSRYLSSRGINASRIFASGKGEAYPVADNNIAAGRQLNRRVEVTIENPIVSIQ